MELMDKKLELLQLTLSQLVANSLNQRQDIQTSQTTLNSQNMEEIIDKSKIPPNLREVKSIITLRSGK